MNLSSIFKSGATQKSEAQQCPDLLVSPDPELIERITEGYAIEGFGTPKTEAKLERVRTWAEGEYGARILILDLRHADEQQLRETVEANTTQLDVQISVIILGKSDSIRLKNWVEAQGARYLLWEGNVNGLIHNVGDLRRPGPAIGGYRARTAKRLLVLGSKGGVGVSCVSSALTHLFSAKAGLPTLLVDHDNGAVSSDLYLGIEGLKIRQNSSDLSHKEIDASIARTYLNRVNGRADALMLESVNNCVGFHAPNLLELSRQLAQDYNFIIDSVPSTLFDEVNDPGFAERYHRIYVVLDPSVSSLRAYNQLKRKLDKIPHRVILNQSRPNGDYALSMGDALEKLKMESALQLPYEAGLEKGLIQKGQSFLESKRLLRSLAAIVDELAGKRIYGGGRLRWLSR
ncbi:type II secretion protein [Ferrimonas sediminicola]|uniref:Type II secretion protein n=1 Tax=Ferrimonas sediminicola TaxID=2569538 RepID=A0A4U1BF03_9GAMM|nr:type II secretion protein [Ferrimonas sediminicola]TKB48930.1 type II secretion protein [Ferrimonas sediminicola]